MTKPVDPAALDPETRRLADRGACEAFGVPLDTFVDNLRIAGEAFDKTDLEALAVAPPPDGHGNLAPIFKRSPNPERRSDMDRSDTWNPLTKPRSAADGLWSPTRWDFSGREHGPGLLKQHGRRLARMRVGALLIQAKGGRRRGQRCF